MVGSYIEELGRDVSKPTVKQHLAAIRMLCDWLVLGHTIESNPAAAVRGPKYVVKRGKTPALDADQTQALFDPIDTSTPVGLRDRALLGVMAFGFARIGATLAMNVDDDYQDVKRWTFRLQEQGGKQHHIVAHSVAEAFTDAYLTAAKLTDAKGTPIFRTARGRTGERTANRMSRADVLRMIGRRARAANLPPSTCCHTFRATAITNYLENGGTIERAASMSAHESTRTTGLYDRRDDESTVGEVERINYSPRPDLAEPPTS